MTTVFQARELGEAFAAVHQEVVVAVEGLAADTTGRSRDEGWPLYFAALHIAEGYAAVMGLALLIANEQPLPPITRELLDAGNAAALAEHGACTRARALAALRGRAAETMTALSALTDAQLARSAAVELFGNAPLTVRQVVEQVLIGHTRAHLDSLRAAA